MNRKVLKKTGCSSTRYMKWKDIKALMADLMLVHQSVNEDEALHELICFKEK